MNKILGIDDEKFGIKNLNILYSSAKSHKKLLIFSISILIFGLLSKNNILGQIGAILIISGIICSFGDIDFDDWRRIEERMRPVSGYSNDRNEYIKIREENLEKYFLDNCKHPFNANSPADASVARNFRLEYSRKCYVLRKKLEFRVNVFPGLVVVCVGTFVNGFSDCLHKLAAGWQLISVFRNFICQFAC